MKKTLTCVLLITMLLTGCSFPAEQIESVSDSIRQAAKQISDGEVLTTEEEQSEAEQTEAETESMENYEAAISEKTQQGNYAFDHLNKEEKVLYIEIYQILINHETDVKVSTLDSNEIEKVFQCVLDDHPEIFYVDGYTFTKYTKAEKLQKISFSGSYLYTQEEIQNKKKQIDGIVRKILSGIPANAGGYEKVKYIYEYLIMHTEYDQKSSDNQNICSVFLNGKSVCQGYAKAAQYLMNKAGVFATLVVGTVDNGEGHAWNLVLIDGDYYYVDVTWGDASYVMTEEQSGYDGKLPQLNYEYLCVTTNQLLRTHKIGGVTKMPECTALKANYYVREDAYFTEPDMDKVSRLFEKAYRENTEYVTLKCADDEIYEQIKKKLVEEQEVFQYLHVSDGTIAYTNNKEQLSLSFWL